MPNWDAARRVILRLAYLLIGVHALLYARYFLLFGPENLPVVGGALLVFALLFLNLYLGYGLARWFLIVAGCVVVLRSITHALAALRRLQFGVVFLLGLLDAAYVVASWQLVRSPELNRFFKAPDRHTPASLVRLTGVVSYIVASAVLAGVLEELPPLGGCMRRSVCTGAANPLGIRILFAFSVSRPVVIVAGWSGPLPGYTGRSR